VFFVATITTINGKPASVLGLAAHPEQSPQCIQAAFNGGINYFFFYGPGHKEFIAGLRPLIKSHRNDVILASGSGSRTASGLRTARRKIFKAAGLEALDIFFAEYVNASDSEEAIFGQDGVLDELQKWKAAGMIRYAGATAHDRQLAKRLAEDSRVDVLMHRFNMAHRKAADEVIPAARAARTPVVAFTATRWGTLLKQQAGWPAGPPSAADCYRFCLAQPAVRIVLTAPKSVAELNENISVLGLPPMNEEDCRRWHQFGDLIYDQGRRGSHDFESRWP
jgi:aryl-alcohol dehydrogenase-like predicted oxidoreductase